MLHHRKELELTAQQVEGLERLRDDYQREAIRAEGELRIGEMELEGLLRAEPVNVEKVKMKLQEVERLRIDLRFARIRAMEEGKALLSAEQREKLQRTLDAPQQLGVFESAEGSVNLTGLVTEPALEYEK
jgi:Spy/CpxP family protein refolding chaperone